MGGTFLYCCRAAGGGGSGGAGGAGTAAEVSCGDCRPGNQSASFPRARFEGDPSRTRVQLGSSAKRPHRKIHALFPGEAPAISQETSGSTSCGRRARYGLWVRGLTGYTDGVAWAGNVNRRGRRGRKRGKKLLPVRTSANGLILRGLAIAGARRWAVRLVGGDSSVAGGREPGL